MGLLETNSGHIGLVGISGTGKSTLATHLREILGEDRPYLSLSSFVRSLTTDFHLAPTRDNFAQVAARCRQRMWNWFLATFAYGAIAHGQSQLPYIIDGIRHTDEIEFLRRKLSITLIGIKVDDRDILAERIAARAKPTDNITPEGIRATLQRERQSSSMNVEDCLPLCDVVVDNSWNVEALHAQIDHIRHSLLTTLSH